jgi:branched-chain amino acid aminotransferase
VSGEPVVWIDGTLAPAGVARVSPFDHALLTGDGVFETLRIYRGVPFAARRHLARLARSAAGLGLPCPPVHVVRDAMSAVVAANGLTEGRLRVTLTGGAGPLGSARGESPPTLIVAATPMEPPAPTVDVAICPWPRNERSAVAGLKTVSYAENVVALAWARERGADEAIFANCAGSLCEGTGTNVFAVIDGRLVTPPLAAGCLAGVTRELVSELVAVEEVDVPVARLRDATEAFLTSSTREVQPIRAVDGVPLPHCPGPATAAAAAAFADLVARDLDP